MSTNLTEKYQINSSADGLCLQLSGDWRFQSGIPNIDPLLTLILDAHPEKLSFDCQQLGDWDSGLMIFLVNLINSCQQNNIQVLQEPCLRGYRNYSSWPLPYRNAKGRAVQFWVNRFWRELATSP